MFLEQCLRQPCGPSGDTGQRRSAAADPGGCCGVVARPATHPNDSHLELQAVSSIHQRRCFAPGRQPKFQPVRKAQGTAAIPAVPDLGRHDALQDEPCSSQGSRFRGCAVGQAQG